MINVTPSNWGDVLCTPDGKYNPLGVHWTAPEKPQLLLRHDPRAYKYINHHVAQVRKEQQWKLK